MNFIEFHSDNIHFAALSVVPVYFDSNVARCYLMVSVRFVIPYCSVAFIQFFFVVLVFVCLLCSLGIHKFDIILLHNLSRCMVNITPKIIPNVCITVYTSPTVLTVNCLFTLSHMFRQLTGHLQPPKMHQERTLNFNCIN